jgi:poly(3-hydroxybutyrate) depolymerase
VVTTWIGNGGGHPLRTVVGVLSVLLLGLQAAPAGATVLREEPFAGTDSYAYADCGYPVDVEAAYEGTASIRVGKNKDASAFFLRQSVSFREVHTNTVTGEWFVVSGHSTFREVKATQVEGSVYEFTQVESGQPFVVEDSSGRVVLRDRGSIRYHVVFDTGGDEVPGGEFVDFLGVEVRGPHPGFFTDFCRVAGDLVGISDSSQRYTLHAEGTTHSPLGYAEYLPPDYASDGASPLLVFLHGSGESGDGSAEQLGHLAWQAIPKYIANDGWPSERPFVVLAPQHEDSGDPDAYSPCDAVEFPGSCGTQIQHDLGNPTPGSVCFTPAEVDSFISYAVGHYGVDPKRVYLTGISCGGFGAWEYLAEHGGDQVAAAVPIAANGGPAWDTAGCSLGDVALWAFHGEQDDIVNPAGSTQTIANVQACPSPPREEARVTTYADADHDSWTRTYTVGAEDDIYAWMLGFSHA